MKDHQINLVSLCFVDGVLEEHYSSEKEKRSGAAFCCCMIVLCFITTMQVFIDPLWVCTYDLYKLIQFTTDMEAKSIQTLKFSCEPVAPLTWTLINLNCIVCFASGSLFVRKGENLTGNVSSCSRLTVNYVTFVIGELLLLILTVCSLAAIFPRVRKQKSVYDCGDGKQLYNRWKLYLWFMIGIKAFLKMW